MSPGAVVPVIPPIAFIYPINVIGYKTSGGAVRNPALVGYLGRVVSLKSIIASRSVRIRKIPSTGKPQ